jgi:hypothetical protein
MFSFGDLDHMQEMGNISLLFKGLPAYFYKSMPPPPTCSLRPLRKKLSPPMQPDFLQSFAVNTKNKIIIFGANIISRKMNGRRGKKFPNEVHK